MNKKLSIILIIIFVLLFFVWAFWFLGKLFPISKTENYIIDTIPKNQEIDIPIDREIFIYTRNPVKITKKNIQTTPQFKFEIEYLKKQNGVKIKPLNFLEKNKNYKIVIKVKSIKNSPYEISFKTNDVIESALKQDIILLLKNKIPVYSARFDLTYLEDKEAFSAIINIPDCQLAKESVLNYLKKNGINPSDVKIIWYTAIKNGDLSCTENK
jgi:hypothetical protein